jgi:hypothetical protein
MMPAEEARDKARVPRGDLASVAPANLAAAKEEFFAKKARFCCLRFLLDFCCKTHFLCRDL